MKGKYRRILLTCITTVMLLTSFVVGGVSLASEEKALTFEDVANMAQKELDSLTSEQISEITDSISGLSEKELSAIDAETSKKIVELWKRDGAAKAESDLKAALSKIDTEKTISIGSPGLRSSQYFYSANWGDSGGGGWGFNDWDSSYSGRYGYVWADTVVLGNAYAYATTGVSFNTDSWGQNESHSVNIIFDGWTGWGMGSGNPLDLANFYVNVYVYDITGETYIGSTQAFYQWASLVWNDESDFEPSVGTTLYADRDYLVFVYSYIGASCSGIFSFCQAYSDGSGYGPTHWNWIELDWQS